MSMGAQLYDRPRPDHGLDHCVGHYLEEDVEEEAVSGARSGT